MSEKSMGVLHVVRPGRSMRQVVMAAPSFAVGRDAGCHLLVDEDGVEPRHAVICATDGEVRISSPGGGVLVNRTRTTVRRLLKGDVITVGSHRLVYLPELPADDGASPSVRELANGVPPLVRRATPLTRRRATLPLAPSPAGSSAILHDWALQFRRVAGDAQGLPDVAGRVSAMGDGLEKTDVVVAFAGHFSSGKSTLINALLGVDVMPTDDRPDTGTICRIRSGSRDTARLLNAGGLSTISCTDQGLKDAISLYARGNLNEAVHEVSCLDLTLAGLPLPPRQVWMDTPGINESNAMELRVAEAMDQADIVVWVLNSRQFLSMTEQKVLRQFRNCYNPHGMLFVLNVFLGLDTEKRWGNYQRQKLPILLARLQDAAENSGFESGNLPVILPICARSLASHEGCDFGGEAVCDRLRSIDSCHHPLVAARRIHRACMAVEVLGNELSSGPQSSVTRSVVSALQALQGAAPEIPADPFRAGQEDTAGAP